jgi:hypothetical protein
MAFDTLQLLAAKFSLDGHPLQAMKCLEASLSLSPMPADAAQVRLRAARLLLQHTTNLAEVKQHLQKAVSAVCDCHQPGEVAPQPQPPASWVTSLLNRTA